MCAKKTVRLANYSAHAAIPASRRYYETAKIAKIAQFSPARLWRGSGEGGGDRGKMRAADAKSILGTGTPVIVVLFLLVVLLRPYREGGRLSVLIDLVGRG